MAHIQEVMEHYGLTVSAFADTVGVQRSSVSHLLNGRNKPSLDFVMKLVDAYPEVDLYWLLNGTGSFPRADGPKKSPTLNFPDDTITEEPRETKISSPEKPKASQKEPVRIVMFYNDGTFQSFDAKK